MDEFRRANRDLWDVWAQINAGSKLYRLPQFKEGQNKLHSLEREELRDVSGKSLLHLMCHFGMDTLSWARLGASVTGVDFSPEAIRMARELGAEVGVAGRFICCELYELPAHLEETFDIVYTSYGVLSWLPDLAGWARIVARYLKPGGVFYMAEIHPLTLLFEEEVTEPRWQVRYDYFDTGVLTFQESACYSDASAVAPRQVHHEWIYRTGDVVSHLIDSGLRIEFLHEHPFTCYQAFPFLERGEDGWWRAPASLPRVPLLFSLRAMKEDAITRRPTDHSMGRSRNHSTDSSMDHSTDESRDHSMDSSRNHSTDSSMDHSTDSSMDRERDR